ncbi:MAG TPA: energy-coupling factor transporter ATPase [Candidatus Avacidaminococcus intestinavium]|uniref:Energy-coupling factor transporter ATP-binding protein EcfA2 n=1 Tax=Candidatus Avacidaminococcus intestinavium TaxID=2840684 RepID=A0A9D1MN78_9FIRM|nr:energy-coupling factor transporter ATPase [Candidatus Avacidaminococcus intestinavium]
MSIELDNISYTYMKKTPYERTALKNISLEIKKGEFVAVIGSTGSGKSTLMQHFNALLKPDCGTVKIDNIDINIKSRDCKSAKNKVGMVFQYPEHQIFAETAYEDVAFGPRNKGLSEEEVERAVRSALKCVNLDYDTYALRSPFQLSGGQMRRLAIAGILAMEPDYLILDEPSAGLDPKARDDIFREIGELYETRKMAVILVTHSMEEAATYADRLLVMSKGKIVIDASPQTVFQKQRKLLKEVGLDVPETIKLAECLNARGLNIAEDVIQKQDLVTAILEWEGLK